MTYTPLEAIQAAARANEEREAAIARSDELHQQAKAEKERLAAEAKQTHRDANRAFVAAIRQASEESPMSIGDLMGSVDKPVQLFYRLSKQIERWDAEEADAS